MSNTCMSCGASIRWVVTDAGRRMPVDEPPMKTTELEALARGSVVVLVALDGPALVLGAREAEGRFDDTRHTIHRSHFARCPFASAHRRKSA